MYLSLLLINPYLDLHLDLLPLPLPSSLLVVHVPTLVLVTVNANQFLFVSRLLRNSASKAIFWDMFELPYFPPWLSFESGLGLGLGLGLELKAGSASSF